MTIPANPAIAGPGCIKVRRDGLAGDGMRSGTIRTVRSGSLSAYSNDFEGVPCKERTSVEKEEASRRVSRAGAAGFGKASLSSSAGRGFKQVKSFSIRTVVDRPPGWRSIAEMPTRSEVDQARAMSSGRRT